MSENETKTCPKCSGIMKLGNLGGLRWFKGTSFWKAVHGSGVYAFKCENCGYIELYSERKAGVKP